MSRPDALAFAEILVCIAEARLLLDDSVPFVDEAWLEPA